MPRRADPCFRKSITLIRRCVDKIYTEIEDRSKCGIAVDDSAVDPAVSGGGEETPKVWGAEPALGMAAVLIHNMYLAVI